MDTPEVVTDGVFLFLNVRFRQASGKLKVLLCVKLLTDVFRAQCLELGGGGVNVISVRRCATITVFMLEKV
jgi:hypothetical protein